MNLKLLLFPVAFAAEAIALPFRGGRELGIGNWCLDRKVGDPKGKIIQTREQARNDQYIKSKQPPQ